LLAVRDAEENNWYFVETCLWILAHDSLYRVYRVLAAGRRTAERTERRHFWEICEDRYQMRSTILTSQLPVSRWPTAFWTG